MWEITLYNQIFGVLVSLSYGFCLALFYDILKAYCIKYSPSKLFVFFKDLLFAILAAVSEFLLLMALTNGAIRGYLLISQAVGFVLFRLFVSVYWLKVVSFLLNCIGAVYVGAEAILKKTNEIITAFEKYILKIALKIYKNGLKKKKTLETANV